MNPRPDSTTVADRIVAYLFRTGTFDWAGGRQAAYEKRWGNNDGPLAFLNRFKGVKTFAVDIETVPPRGSFENPVRTVQEAARIIAAEHPMESMKPVGISARQAFNVGVRYFPFPPPEPPKFGPERPPKPMGFWPLIEHSFSIGYTGDIRTCRAEAERDGDTECVEICDLLLLMKRTAREKCGDKVEDQLFVRRGY